VSTLRMEGWKVRPRTAALGILVALGLADVGMAGAAGESHATALAPWTFAGNAGRSSAGPLLVLRDGATDSLYLLRLRNGSDSTPAYLWRSDDAGSSWNPLRRSSPDTLVALKADPFHAGVVWALHATEVGELQLWESEDRGQHWQVTGGPAAEPSANSASLVVSQRVQDRVFVSGQGLWRSDDRGATWELLSSVGRSGLVEHPTDPDVLLAVAPGLPLLMRSVDGGRHWHLLSQVIDEGTLGDFVLAPSEPDRVYAISSRGVLRSDDGGRQWAVVRPLEPWSCPLPVVDGADRDRLVLADLCAPRLLTTDDGGAEWTEVILPARGGASSFAIDPRDLDDVWFTGGDLRHSRDGGLTSQVSPTPVPGAERVEFVSAGPRAGPNAGPSVYALSGSSLWLGSGEGWRRRGAVPGAGGGSMVVAVDPENPQTISYARYPFFWRSVDGGKTVTRVSAEFDQIVSELTFDRHRSGRLLAATSEDAWFSDDGGAHWTNFTTAIPTGLADGHHGATFPSRRVSRVVQDATARDTLSVVREDELFVTTDRGASWKRRSVPEIPDSLTADPLRSNTVYLLSTVGPRLHQSVDGGRTWSSSPLPVAGDVGISSAPVLRFDRRGNLAVFVRDAVDCSALPWPITRGARAGAPWRRLGARLPSGCLRDLVASEAPDGGTRWLAAIDGAGTWRLDVPAQR
jgi:photosystem II stability/assembly factor-like uncharacterized protein